MGDRARFVLAMVAPKSSPALLLLLCSVAACSGSEPGEGGEPAADASGSGAPASAGSDTEQTGGSAGGGTAPGSGGAPSGNGEDANGGSNSAGSDAEDGSDGVNSEDDSPAASDDGADSAGNPDSSSDGTDPQTDGTDAAGSTHDFARLTRAEYRATVLDALGVDPPVTSIPEDGRVGPFTSNAEVSTDPVHPYLLASEELASEVIGDRLPACGAEELESCLRENYQGALERLYRRAVTDAELEQVRTLMQALLDAGASDVEASRAMLAASLLSPDFLFRSSPSSSGDAPEARRVAERLSYALWDAPPDDALRSSAADGASLPQEAARLLQDERAIPVVARFVAQWLDVDTDLRLENAEFESSPPYLEWLALIEHTIEQGTPVVELLAGENGFVHEDNADAYALSDVDTEDGEDVARVTWPDESPRRGVLAQDLIVGSSRHPDLSRRPIFRGLLVRRALLCDEIPAPSADLVALASEVGDRTEDIRCAGCHQLIDPIGRAFGVLDPDLGEAELDAIPAAEIVGHAELTGTYADLPALLRAIADSRTFAECFAEHWLEFLLELPVSALDEAWVSELADAVQGGASLGQIVEQTASGLLARQTEVAPWCEGF